METNKYNQDYVDGLSGPKAWFSKFCSTFNIVSSAVGAGIASGYWDGQPTYRAQFADNALSGAATFVGCTSAFATGAEVRAVRAYVWLKNYRFGVATSSGDGFRFELQVAAGVAGFNARSSTTGTGVIDVKIAARATSAFLLTGIVPANEAISAARIAVFPSVLTGITDTASFDCNIDAVP